MVKRILLRLFLAIALVLALLSLIGGGFGKKVTTTRLDGIDTAWFAHRSGAGVFPENSLEGVQRAYRLGYTGVEVDVRATADGAFVLFHDDSCQRLLGVEGAMAERTLSGLQALHLRLRGVVSACHVPTLDTVLSAFGDSLLFYLDVKVTTLSQADAIAAIIERHHAFQNTFVASSSIPFIAWLEFHHPEVNTVLEGFDRGEEWTYSLFPEKFRPDLLSSFAFETDSTQIGWLREQGLLRHKIVYGLDAVALQRARSLGLSRFIVDEGVPPIGPQ
jgi:glycerophosphoryl diester phosphodiesterase